MIKRYTEDEGIDKVFLIYNEFKSVLQQRVILEQLLPVSRAKKKNQKRSRNKPVISSGLHLRTTTRRDIWPTSAAAD